MSEIFGEFQRRNKMRIRKFLYIVILAALSSYCQTQGQTRSEQLMELLDDFPKITVEASVVGGGSLDKKSMCRLVAMCKGDLHLRKYRHATISMGISKVIDGSLYAPDFANRPVGTKALEVIVINDAAMAFDKSGAEQRPSRATGIWKLSTLPNGAYIVSSLSDTPFANVDIAAEKNAAVTIGDDLKSGDPDRQNQALQQLKETESFTHIELIFPLLDSDQKVMVPNAISVRFKDGGSRMLPRESTLGAEAGNVLWRLTSPLRTEGSPGKEDDKTVWQRWWKGILDIEPFPDVHVEKGPVKVLTEIPMNQSWPYLRLSPDGRHTLLGVSRYRHLVNNARSGIRLLDFERKVDDDFVYKVPVNERNAEPTGLAAAWHGDSAAVAWKEYFYDEKLRRVKFMTLSLFGTHTVPVDLNLKQVSNMALCYSGDRQWLLICTAKPEDYDHKNRSDRKRRELFVMKLDSSGKVLLRTQPLEMPVQPNNSFSDSIQTVNAVSTPKGTAVIFTNSSVGPFLLLLDKELNVRGFTQVNDPKSRQSTSVSKIVWNGKVLCTSWISRRKLFVRKFNEDGQPVTKQQQVASSVLRMSGPVACQDGFALAWTCKDFLADHVRFGIVPNNGSEMKQYLVYKGVNTVGPIELAAVGDKVRVMMYDRQMYPRRLLLKEITLK
jgi:hypothetical protein